MKTKNVDPESFLSNGDSKKKKYGQKVDFKTRGDNILYIDYEPDAINSSRRPGFSLYIIWKLLKRIRFVLYH